MTKATIPYLLAGIGVLLIGTGLGRNLGLTQFASVGIGLVPALLLAYPLMKRWYRGHLSFTVWILTVAGSAIAATLINFVIG
ncbi:MAG TPA: hypothetical protein VF527_11820 [Pyrinomonadaceae bacterium]|jgi:hypothetical protein